MREQFQRAAGPAPAGLDAGAEAEPAAVVPADPPRLGRQHRRALPARGGAAVPGRSSRSRCRASSSPRLGAAEGSPPLAVELALDRAQVLARARSQNTREPAVLDRGRPGQRQLRRRAACVPQKSQVTAIAASLRRTGPRQRLRCGALLSCGAGALAPGERSRTLTATGLGGRVRRAQSERARARRACWAGALGTAGEPPGRRELVPASQFVRLSQARGHLCACQVFDT